MNSAIYVGDVRHRRLRPKPHAFRYTLFMVYLDLEELDDVFRGRWLWSTRRRALARFCREDHLGDPAEPLDVAVRALVEARTGSRPVGRICLLTHLRYWGYVMNPLSVYYCFDATDTRVEYLVLEVNNTPWGERHCYVMQPVQRGTSGLAAEFRKDFHVSPFLSMDYTYEAALSTPAARLVVHLANHDAQERIFDATLALRREPITGRTLARALAIHPWMTAKVIGAIYWEALKLWAKGFQYYAHGKPISQTME